VYLSKFMAPSPGRALFHPGAGMAAMPLLLTYCWHQPTLMAPAERVRQDIYGAAAPNGKGGAAKPLPSINRRSLVLLVSHAKLAFASV
jgi:hypothetical protein